jgi:acyl-CoA synthetase (AMP-forming)/AMP-acid ligase II
MPHPTLAEVLRRGAAERAGDVALVTPGARLTYGALDRRANRLAGALAAAGVGPQDRVALLARNGASFF